MPIMYGGGNMAKDEADKMRQVRKNAAYWNKEVERIRAKIDALTTPPEPYDSILAELRYARDNAGYWNQIVNNENGYI